MKIYCINCIYLYDFGSEGEKCEAPQNFSDKTTKWTWLRPEIRDHPKKANKDNNCNWFKKRRDNGR